MECSRERGYCETGRPGYSGLSPLWCSCNFPALQGLVQTGLWTWLEKHTWEIWWQVLTSIIRAGCNTGGNHGYLKTLFWLRSRSDWRATSVLRNQRKPELCAGSSQLPWSEACGPKCLPSSLTPSRPRPCPYGVWQRTEDNNRTEKEKNVKKQDRNFKRERKNQGQQSKRTVGRMSRFQNLKAPS